jgi:phosphoribosylformylglycinamidine synthase
MSGSFLDLDVPPTLISFAIAPIKADMVLSPEFKQAGNPVYLFAPVDNTPDAVKAAWEAFHELHKAGKVKAAWAVENGLAEAVMKMSFGNNIGFKSCGTVNYQWYAAGMYDFIVAELSEEITLPCTLKIGETTTEPSIVLDGESATIAELLAINEGKLESVYPTVAPAKESALGLPVFSYTNGTNASPAVKVARPKVLIPVFPGTNCEYDSARAVEAAGAEADILVVRNLSADDVSRSVEAAVEKIKQSQMIFIPGGFSGGDEPDGSAKFITAFFRNPAVKEGVTDLLDNRDGLMCGICNGFQALIKLGLVPYGKIIDTDENCPTLTFNTISRHQSKLVRTRVCTNKSPWLSLAKVGDIYTVPISHGEGRFLASDELIAKLADNGQIATQYVDLDGAPTMDTAFNPNGSICAIEGITSPDGRVFGKMGHSERIANGLYKNVYGDYDIKMFKSMVKYFK